MPDPSDDMTEEQLADWQYAHRQQMDADEGDEVDVDISPRLSVTMSFRLPADEADAIRTTASRAGMTLSDWIRRACAAAVQEDETRTSLTPVVQQLAEVFQDLTDARDRLGTVLGDEAPTDDPTAPRQRTETGA